MNAGFTETGGRRVFLLSEIAGSGSMQSAEMNAGIVRHWNGDFNYPRSQARTQGNFLLQGEKFLRLLSHLIMLDKK
jgi:hypothetical protein